MVRFALRIIAASVVELARIPQLHPLEVPLIRMPPRYGEIMPPIEFELRFQDPEWLSGYFALNRPIDDIIRDLADRFREPCAGDDFRDIRLRILIIRPSEAKLQCFRTREREILHHRRLVVSERTDPGREEFSPLPCLGHVIDDLRDESFVFVFRILPVEDAIALPLQSDTSEAIGASVHAERAVEEIPDISPAIFAEEDVICIQSAGNELIGGGDAIPEHCDVGDILHRSSDVVAVHHIFRIDDIVAMIRIFRVEDAVSDTRFTMLHVQGRERAGSDQLSHPLTDQRRIAAERSDLLIVLGLGDR